MAKHGCVFRDATICTHTLSYNKPNLCRRTQLTLKALQLLTLIKVSQGDRITPSKARYRRGVSLV